MNVFADSTFLALLAACRVSPDDDVPRVALSEWLQERDHPWGNFIHLQLEHHWRYQEFLKRAGAEDEAALVRKQNGIEVADETGSADAGWRDRALQELRSLWSQAISLKRLYWQEWTIPPGQYDWKVRRLHDMDYDRPGPRSDPSHSVFVSFHRGLLDKVICATDIWFGSYCVGCEGDGRVREKSQTDTNHERYSGEWSSRYVTHHHCEGLGLVRGLGPLLAAHPVRQLLLTDLTRVDANDGISLELWDVPRSVINRCPATRGFNPRRRNRVTEDRMRLACRQLGEEGLEWARDAEVIEKNSHQWRAVDRPVTIGRPVTGPLFKLQD